MTWQVPSGTSPARSRCRATQSRAMPSTRPMNALALLGWTGPPRRRSPPGSWWRRFRRRRGLRFLGQEGVEDGIRDAVADLVGMALGDGLRSEDVILAGTWDGAPLEIPVTPGSRCDGSMRPICAGLRGVNGERRPAEEAPARAGQQQRETGRSPKRAYSVGGRGAGMAGSRKPPARAGFSRARGPRASITAETPVLATRTSGSPCSTARSRAWARCW